jgi:hypothetical protein
LIIIGLSRDTNGTKTTERDMQKRQTPPYDMRYKYKRCEANSAMVSGAHHYCICINNMNKRSCLVLEPNNDNVQMNIYSTGIGIKVQVELKSNKVSGRLLKESTIEYIIMKESSLIRLIINANGTEKISQ